jgi:hypothetical protein
MIKNRLILTGIFIEMGVIEIEYELNKIKVFTKSDEEPIWSGLPGQFQPVFTYNPTVFILILFVSCFL